MTPDTALIEASRIQRDAYRAASSTRIELAKALERVRVARLAARAATSKARDVWNARAGLYEDEARYLWAEAREALRAVRKLVDSKQKR